MNRTKLILAISLITLIMVCVVPTPTSTFVDVIIAEDVRVQADDIPQSFDILVPAYGSRGIDTKDGGLGERIYGSFEVQYFSDITFFILDYENQHNYTNGIEPVTKHCLIENVESSDFEFEIPYTDRWHMWLENEDSSLEQHVVGILYFGLVLTDTTTTETTTTDTTTTTTTVVTTGNGATDGEASDDDQTLIFQFLVIGAVGVVIVAAIFKKRTGPSSVVPPDAKVLIICPFCGSKTEQGITKCQKCGAEL